MKIKGKHNFETMPQNDGTNLVKTDDSRLSDARTPTSHGSSHQDGGADEVGTGTPGANAIPKADGTGKFADGWVAESNVTQHEGAVDHDALTNYALAQHRQINDGGTGSTDLWSASKINTELAAVQANLDIKDSVETVADSNITLSGEQTINGVLTSSSRVGVVGQTTASENGIYVSSSGAWSRSSDADEDSEVTQGMSFFVADGDLKGWQYILITPDPITVGTTSLSFAEVPKIELGTTSGTACEGDDARLPTQDENDALAGTNGTPSSSNKYVTNSDPRNSDARTPSAHNLGGSEHSSDTLANLNAKVSDATLIDTADSRLSDDRTASGIRTASTVVSVSAAAAPTTGQILKATSGTAATWQDESGGGAPAANTAEATGDTTTTSGSDVLVDSMTLMPASGNYLVWFSGSVVSGSNGASISMSIYAAGSQLTASEEKYLRGNQAIHVPFCCVAKVTVNGSQAIEGRWKTTAGTATMHQRTLAILKVA